MNKEKWYQKVPEIVNFLMNFFVIPIWTFDRFSEGFNCWEDVIGTIIISVIALLNFVGYYKLIVQQ